MFGNRDVFVEIDMAVLVAVYHHGCLLTAAGSWRRWRSLLQMSPCHRSSPTTAAAAYVTTFVVRSTATGMHGVSVHLQRHVADSRNLLVAEAHRERRLGDKLSVPVQLSSGMFSQ